MPRVAGGGSETRRELRHARKQVVELAAACRWLLAYARPDPVAERDGAQLEWFYNRRREIERFIGEL